MNLQMTEEQRMLSDALGRYLSKEYDFATRQKIAYGTVGFSPRHWKELADLGVISALFPENAGGLGGDAADVQVVFESLGHWLCVEPFLDTLIVGRALMAAGDTSRLAGLIEGTTVAVLAHDEPGSHYEMSRVTTRAEEVNGGWVLNGAKMVVRHAESADHFLVSARISGADDADEGVALFFVPRDSGGLSVRGYGRIDGGRAGELTLRDMHVGPETRVDTGGERGATILDRGIAWGILAICAEALGALDIARRDTLEFLRTRKQFGVPLGSFQALQHRMANLLIEIEQARSAVTNAVVAMNEPDSARARALSAAKYSIGHIGALAAEECIQLHGGIGTTWELPLPHYAKRLVMIDHELGDQDHHLQRYIELSGQRA